MIWSALVLGIPCGNPGYTFNSAPLTIFADIEFRSFQGERHACIKGALPVWQLIMVAKDYGMDAEKTAAHFQWPVHRVKAGFHYYEAYPQEIDQAIADNASMTFDKLKRLLPQLEAISVSQAVLEAEDAS